MEIDNCVTQKDIHSDISNGQIIALMIISLFIFISIFSTICDLFGGILNLNNKKLIIEVIRCFSAKSNTENLFNLETDTNKIESYNFQFINGLKVISTIWVVFGHSYTAGVLLLFKDIFTANFYRKFFTLKFINLKFNIYKKNI